MKAYTHLKNIFEQSPSYAWDILEAQCNIYLSHNITVKDIKYLSELYLKVIERLNSLQDWRQKYFVDKMQKFMAQPYVIRCFNNQVQGKKGALDSKRKNLQQKLSLQTQKNQPQVLQHLLKQQNQKQKKMTEKIQQIIKKHDSNFEARLKKRKMQVQEKLNKTQSEQTSDYKPSNVSSPREQLNPERSLRKSSSEIAYIGPYS